MKKFKLLVESIFDKAVKRKKSHYIRTDSPAGHSSYCSGCGVRIRTGEYYMGHAGVHVPQITSIRICPFCLLDLNKLVDQWLATLPEDEKKAIESVTLIRQGLELF